MLTFTFLSALSGLQRFVRVVHWLLEGDCRVLDNTARVVGLSFDGPIVKAPFHHHSAMDLCIAFVVSAVRPPGFALAIHWPPARNLGKQFKPQVLD